MIDVLTAMQLRQEQESVARFLRENQDLLETHRKVAGLLRIGIGGQMLAELYSEVMDALNPTVREELFAEWPRIKVQHYTDARERLDK